MTTCNSTPSWNIKGQMGSDSLLKTQHFVRKTSCQYERRGSRGNFKKQWKTGVSDRDGAAARERGHSDVSVSIKAQEQDLSKSEVEPVKLQHKMFTSLILNTTTLWDMEMIFKWDENTFTHKVLWDFLLMCKAQTMMCHPSAICSDPDKWCCVSDTWK